VIAEAGSIPLQWDGGITPYWVAELIAIQHFRNMKILSS
jgi:hypothetical protein